MKRNIPVFLIALIGFLLVETTQIRAQAPEGTIRYLQTQNWAKMMSTLDYLSKNQRDRMMYMWGNRSEWKSYTLLHFNATESKYEDSEEAAEPGNEGWSNRKELFFMKRNFKESTLYDGVYFLGKNYLIHDSIVDKKKWISESKFLHALNYCMVLPGPEAQQLATYIGWMLHGNLGGLAAGILFVLPSMFILLGLSAIYVSFGNLPWIFALFSGLKPAIIAIVILALIKIGRKSLLSPFHYFIALV